MAAEVACNWRFFKFLVLEKGGLLLRIHFLTSFRFKLLSIRGQEKEGSKDCHCTTRKRGSREYRYMPFWGT